MRDRSQNCDQMLANRVEWHDAICVPFKIAARGMPGTTQVSLALRDRHSATLSCASLGAVFAHACHQNSHAHWAKFL